jgi:transposase
MYVDSSKVKQGDKVYTRHLLRESYREGKTVKHRTIANLSHCSPEEIEAIRLALRHKKELGELLQGNQVGSKTEKITQKQGLSFGAVWVLADIARQIGISSALGNTREGKLALWQVIARVIDQGSRLSAVRLAGYHAACDIIGLDKFNEDHLYANLDWLSDHQSLIEDRLFRKLEGYRSGSGLYLYDVTSSYFEGTENELAAFGYNRDKKKGKLQIVIGLLCNEIGVPLSIEVFTGNTTDLKTVGAQIEKVKERFGGGEVTMVGDRGMIKNNQIKDMQKEGFHYITAITKPQIDKLLNEKVLQLELFDDELAEIEANEGIRYILRRNARRAEEISKARTDKLASINKEVIKLNQYLKDHQRAKEEVALKKIDGKIKKLKLSEWVTATINEREIIISIDEEELAKESKLDGCYVLKTDLTKKQAAKEIVHDRYKDLTLVEMAFRTSKTVELEVRPINVRLEARTRGHVFVVMLAYRIIQELAKRWKEFNLTVEEGIKELSTLCSVEVELSGVGKVNQLPDPRESIRNLLEAAKVKLPDSLPCKGVNVTTKRKLSERRKRIV